MKGSTTAAKGVPFHSRTGVTGLVGVKSAEQRGGCIAQVSRALGF